MKVEKLLHVHVVVKNLEEAVERFSDLMGTKFIGPLEAISPIVVAFDDLGLELQQPLPSSKSYVADFLRQYGEGVAAVAVKVDSVDEAIAELEAKGVHFLMKGKTEWGKVAVTDPKDSCGVGFELLEFQRMQEMPYVATGKLAELPWM